MTASNSHPDRPGGRPPIDETEQEQCLLYLLGELSADESAAFEQRLAQSHQLNEELLIQSELICAVSTPTKETLPTTIAATSSTRWRAATIVSALAASLAFVVLGTQMFRTNDSHSSEDHGEETLQIAQAWAANPAIDTNTQDELDLAATDDADYEFTAEDAVDDGVPTWMVIAVAADTSASATSPGGTSDG